MKFSYSLWACGVLLVVFSALLTATESDAICPVSVVSYTYYEGCGVPPTIVGDDWKECTGYSGGWGTTGNWREKMRTYCGINESGWCYDNYSVYSYWVNCSGQWLERTQAQMLSGQCNCP